MICAQQKKSFKYKTYNQCNKAEASTTWQITQPPVAMDLYTDQVKHKLQSFIHFCIELSYVMGKMPQSLIYKSLLIPKKNHQISYIHSVNCKHEGVYRLFVINLSICWVHPHLTGGKFETLVRTIFFN